MLLKEILILILIIAQSSSSVDECEERRSNFDTTVDKCEERRYNFDSIVCVCNGTYCDTIATPPKLNQSAFYLYTSNIKGLRFRKIIGAFEDPALYVYGVVIDRSRKYQTIIGFGGSFTDSTGINIASLDNNTQNNLMKSYFSSDGIGFNLGRVPIGGTDFSTREYSYCDGDPDPKLANFKLEPEDLQYKIPYMRKASELLQEDLLFVASAWSPPAWMKIEEQENGYFSRLKSRMYQTWADYHKMFLEEYERYGLKMWGVTTGNEPTTAFGVDMHINRLGWMPDLLRTYIAENLGPTLRTHYPDLKIIILDDQRYLLPWAAQFVITPNTTEYIDGIAIHWYYDDQFSPILIRATHNLFPDKFILNTEGSIIEKNPAVALGSWNRGERYSDDIIQDLTNWVIGWIDWNMVLDLNGGPTWVDNNIDAAIIVNASAGEFYKQPIYYHLGHFSKFVHRGSKRIFSKSDYWDNFSVIAFERPDEAVVVVILNKSNKTVPIIIFDNDRGAAKIAISRRSINTIIYW